MDECRDGPSERVHHLVVAVQNAPHALGRRIARWVSVASHGMRADAPGIGRHETLDELQRKVAVVRVAGASRPSVKELRKAHVTAGCRGQVAHHSMKPDPYVVKGAQPAVVRFESATRDIDASKTRFVQHGLSLVGVAVNKLGAQLEGYRNGGLSMSQDAPANSVPRLEDGDA